ncbi:hypothetical protein ACUN0C_16825 [Faunimonas sp. B44]|uniref:hypothetical protein n=1 Tax=Faunimonas sp. B44 TaxID=3461493 RepID=UPI0040446E73
MYSPNGTEQFPSELPPVGTISNDAVVGHNGQLYLIGGKHEVLEFVSGRRKVRPGSLNTFRRNITDRNRFCEKRGIRYCHVVFPDKHSANPDDFPFDVSTTLLQEYVQGMGGSSLPVYNPLSDLRSVGRAAYVPVDTHLSEAGISAVLHGLLEDSLQMECEAGFRLLHKRLTRTIEYAGDLGVKFEPPIVCSRVVPIPCWPIAQFSNGLSGNDGLIEILVSPQPTSNLRLVVFGDSFLRGMLQHLSAFFAEVTYFRTRYFHKDAISQIQPDVVMTGNVERYFSYVTSDELAPNPLLTPFVNGLKIAPTTGYWAALNAQLCYPRRPYTEFMEEIRSKCVP